MSSTQLFLHSHKKSSWYCWILFWSLFFFFSDTQQPYISLFHDYVTFKNIDNKKQEIWPFKLWFFVYINWSTEIFRSNIYQWSNNNIKFIFIFKGSIEKLKWSLRSSIINNLIFFRLFKFSNNSLFTLSNALFTKKKNLFEVVPKIRSK